MIYKNMWTREEFEEWQEMSGYFEDERWNFQEIGPFDYYFIKNYVTGKYALIKLYFDQDRYEVLVQDWTDLGGLEKHK